MLGVRTPPGYGGRVADEVVVFERRLRGGALWLVVAMASWLLYVPGLVLGLDHLDPVKALFRATPLEDAFAGTVVIVAVIGWFALPMAWLVLWERACLRYGRCELGPDRVAFVQPVQIRRLVVEPGALRVVDCTRWGVLVEAEDWTVELGVWRQRHRGTGDARQRLLVPCAEADHARVLALLGAGPRGS